MKPWHGGNRGWGASGQRSRQYRWVGFVFGFCCGALLALFKRTKPGCYLRPVGEEPSSMDEAQATALEFGAGFSNLLVKI
jgi:ABC-type uncharacterized transport system permease subunit